MKKIYLLLLCCFGIAGASTAQTTVTTQIGGGRGTAAYIYEDGTAYKHIVGEDFNMALVFSRVLKRRFAFRSELGFHDTHTTLNIKHANVYVSGYHQYQQVYMALGPQYYFNDGKLRFFTNAGVRILKDTKNQLDDYDRVIPMHGGVFDIKPGLFAGVGFCLQPGPVHVLFELKYSVQSNANPLADGNYSPGKLKMQRLTASLGVGYSFN